VGWSDGGGTLRGGGGPGRLGGGQRRIGWHRDGRRWPGVVRRHVEAVGRWAETGHAGQSQATPAMWRVEATGGWVDQAMSMRRQR
jgi:hypothetical protein